MHRKIIFVCAMVGCLTYLGSGSAAKTPPAPNARQAATSSQSGTSQAAIDQDIELLRQDIRSKKKQMVAANLKLTDEEATKFWPVYDQYTADLVKINNEKYALIKEYADTSGHDDRRTGTVADEPGAECGEKCGGLEDSLCADLQQSGRGEESGVFSAWQGTDVGNPACA